MIVLQDEGHHDPLPADNEPVSLANVWSWQDCLLGNATRLIGLPYRPRIRSSEGVSARR